MKDRILMKANKIQAKEKRDRKCIDAGLCPECGGKLKSTELVRKRFLCWVWYKEENLDSEFSFWITFKCELCKKEFIT